jgi:SAM-dependent methyltransferase
MGEDSMDADDLGKTGCYDEVLHLLQSADYSDEYICRRFNLDRPEEFELDRKKREPLSSLESAADILLTLFLAGEPVSLETARKFLGAKEVTLLAGMGLLVLDSDAHRCYASVALYPVGDIYIASDRWSNPDGSQLAGPQDTVYPAFIPNTRLFLRHLPERPGGKYLDLCAGTGIAALMAARHGADQAFSGDISDRSTRFAEFNRRLNAISNAQMVTSDLYRSFEGDHFDVISAHPPYVPTIQPKWIFFSGGKDGEEITRRIIEGLPRYLNDGGIFMCLTMGGDRIDQPFEDRIRAWLGSSEREFDVAFLARREIDPLEFALRANRETIRSREESELWVQQIKNLRIASLAYGFICIQRRAGAHRTFTIRRRPSPKTSRAPWEWLLKWETEACSDRLTRRILDSPLHASQAAEFEVLHKLDQGAWNPSSYKLHIDYPFDMECAAQPWMAHLISLCDGKATGREVFRILIENNALPKTTPEHEFARAAASLISGGFVEVEEFRFPPPSGI